MNLKTQQKEQIKNKLFFSRLLSCFWIYYFGDVNSECFTIFTVRTVLLCILLSARHMGIIMGSRCEHLSAVFPYLSLSIEGTEIKYA